MWFTELKSGELECNVIVTSYLGVMELPSRRSPLIILPFFLWGTAMVVMKGVMPQTAPLFMAAMRLLPAGIALLFVAITLGKSQPRGWQAWGWIGLFAIADGTLFQGLLTEGLTRTGAGLGSLLIDSQPLSVAVMAAVLYGERISPRGRWGLGLGLGGIGLIGLPPQLWQSLWQRDWAAVQQIGAFHLGEWLMLGASLSMAVGMILIRPVSRWVDPIMATAWHMVLGSVPLLVLSLFLEVEPYQHLSLWGWAGLGYMTFLGSAIAYGVFFFYASQGSLTTLSALTFSTPVFALLFSSIFLAERLTMTQWLGVACTVVSIYLVSGTSTTAEVAESMDGESAPTPS